MTNKTGETNSEFSEIPDARPTPFAPHCDFLQKIAIAALFAVVLLTLWSGAEVFLLIFTGFLLAVFLRGLSKFVCRYTPLSENLALGLILIVLVGLTAFGGWLLFDSMQTEFDDLYQQLPQAFEQARQKIAEYPLGKRVVEQIPSPQQIVDNQSANLFGRVTGFFSTAFNTVVNVVILLITAIYFAFSPDLYKEGVVKLVPKKREKRTREIIETIIFTLRRYLLGTFVSVTINGVITAVGLSLLGVPFAIPLGIITALFNLVPNIGPIAASVPAILLAFSLSPTKALYVALLYLALQNIDGFVTTPLVQQKAVAIPSVLIIAAQLLLALLFGFLGLLLAVPIVSVIFVLVKMIYVEDILGRRVEVKGEKEAKKAVASDIAGDEESP